MTKPEYSTSRPSVPTAIVPPGASRREPSVVQYRMDPTERTPVRRQDDRGSGIAGARTAKALGAIKQWNTKGA